VLALVVSTSFFIWTMRFQHLLRHTSWPLVGSLIVNVMLVGTLSVVLQKPREQMVLPPPAQKAATAAAKTKPEASKSALAEAKPAPFHWHQLEAPDFPTFVKNLRGIGCPETTIRDIIQCEMDEIYAAKRQEIEREIATAPLQARSALQERLRQLGAEETTMLSASLNGSAIPAAAMAGTQTSASEQGAGTTPAGATGAAQASGSTMTPAAFLVGNDPNQASASGTLTAMPTDPNMNPATSAVISQMRTDFASALQDVSADPSSAMYRQRWLSAQRASDEQFSSMFGGDNFIKTQVEAVRAAAAASAANGKR